MKRLLSSCHKVTKITNTQAVHTEKYCTHYTRPTYILRDCLYGLYLHSWTGQLVTMTALARAKNTASYWRKYRLLLRQCCVLATICLNSCKSCFSKISRRLYETETRQCRWYWCFFNVICIWTHLSISRWRVKH